MLECQDGINILCTICNRVFRIDLSVQHADYHRFLYANRRNKINHNISSTVSAQVPSFDTAEPVLKASITTTVPVSQNQENKETRQPKPIRPITTSPNTRSQQIRETRQFGMKEIALIKILTTKASIPIQSPKQGPRLTPKQTTSLTYTPIQYLPIDQSYPQRTPIRYMPTQSQYIESRQIQRQQQKGLQEMARKINVKDDRVVTENSSPIQHHLTHKSRKSSNAARRFKESRSSLMFESLLESSPINTSRNSTSKKKVVHSNLQARINN